MQSFYLGGPEPNSQKPTSRSCYPKFDNDSFWLYWQASEDDSCGTQKVENGTHILFSNTIQDRDRNLEISFGSLQGSNLQIVLWEVQLTDTPIFAILGKVSVNSQMSVNLKL